MKTHALPLVCFILPLAFIACQKEHTIPITQQNQEEFAALSAESDAQAESIFNGIFDNIIGVNADVGIGGTGIYNSSTATNYTRCFNMTVVHINTNSFFPVRIIVDFGTGCLGSDGKIRKGKIITEYSDSLVITGARARTTFEEYVVNELKVEGTHNVINKSTSAIPSFQILVSCKLSLPNGNFTEWHSDKTIDKVNGNLNFLGVDDTFQVTGFATGIVRKGDRLFQWATHISEPLVKRFNCHWLVKGVVSIRKGASEIATLDYGSGQCDNKASFTLVGHTREITLH
jgi:hypothetical protein